MTTHNDTPGGRSDATAEQRLNRAKHPRSVIAGPYGHPFHATVVTIPIGAWTASVVFDILALCGVEPSAFALAAQWLVAIGIIGAVIAAVLGLLDLSTLASGTKARRIALTHLSFNSVAVVLFVVSFFVRAADPAEVSVFGFILSLIALGCVGVSGFLGGELAYRYGVRVADEATQRGGF